LRIQFYMQFSMQILRSAWAEPAGWALIATGLVVATWTLGSNSRRPKLERPLRSLEPVLSEPDNQWQRLAGILEGDIARAEILPILQARAIAAVEDVDEAVHRLLAECAGSLRPAEAAAPRQGHDALPAPAPVARPLAA
jgi:hypothetical protein